MDQRPVEKRKDVLVYTTAPLKQDLEVTGPIRVVLYASTSAADTDFTAKLVDVFPNGEARNLTDGILRIRYRHGLDKPELAQPGRGLSTEYRRRRDQQRVSGRPLDSPRDFEQQFSALRPQSEHRARVRRRDGAQEGAAVVYHSRLYPSHILLPVIPASETASEKAARRRGPELTSASAARYGAKRSPVVEAKPLPIPAR